MTFSQMQQVTPSESSSYWLTCMTFAFVKNNDGKDAATVI
jgi:hypothetical protein